MKNISISILSVVFLSSCAGNAWVSEEELYMQQGGNPASSYCLEQGGKLRIDKDEKGNANGTCVFQNGSECGEWSFFQGKCGPEEAVEEVVEIPVVEDEVIAEPVEEVTEEIPVIIEDAIQDPVPVEEVLVETPVVEEVKTEVPPVEEEVKTEVPADSVVETVPVETPEEVVPVEEVPVVEPVVE